MDKDSGALSGCVGSTANNVADSIFRQAEKSSPPIGFDPARKYHDLLAIGEIPCRSCPNDWPHPARYIATAKRIDDLSPMDWPVCSMHSEHAMVAGWFPLRTIDEWRAAIADTHPKDGDVEQAPLVSGAAIAQNTTPTAGKG